MSAKTPPSPPRRKVGTSRRLLMGIGKGVYFLMGWRFEPPPPYLRGKHVLIGFPHTSNMDTVRAFTGYRIIGRTGYVMIKQEWFFWPMSILLRALGGIPVRRDAPGGVVGQMAAAFDRRDDFLLALVPEGTRGKVKTIRTGFWHIARAADVSIICWYLDNPNRTARWLGEVWPGEDMADDMLRIRRIYERAGYRFPLDVEALSARSNDEPSSG